MEYTLLGKSNLKVSRIGFGCCPMGMYDWGEVDERDLLSSVQIALDKGVNLFDTSDTYGMGVSESILAKALGSHRPEAIIATKFGVRHAEDGKTFYDNSPAWFNQALEGSLRRLKSDYIDLYQVHYWDGVTLIDDIFEMLESARKKGKIRYYGVTNMDISGLNTVGQFEGFISFSFEYSLVNRTSETIINRMCEDYQLSFLSWGSLGQGFLGGNYDKETIFPPSDRRSRPVYKNFHGERLANNLKILKGLTVLQRAYPGKTLAQLALRWILDFLKPAIALTGIKRPAQIIENAGACGWKLKSEDIQYLGKLSLNQGAFST
jgi:myo-inositol catabolism protein IolS